MRISDWSSDVCSSDLHVIEAICGTQGCPVRLGYSLPAWQAQATQVLRLEAQEPTCHASAIGGNDHHAQRRAQHRSQRTQLPLIRGHVVQIVMRIEVAFVQGKCRLSLDIGYKQLGLDRKSTRLNSSH